MPYGEGSYSRRRPQAFKSDPIRPFRPTAKDVAVAREEDKKNNVWDAFFEALRIPTRLLGGSMLQAGLAWDAEGALRNNPIFQAAQILLPMQP